MSSSPHGAPVGVPAERLADILDIAEDGVVTMNLRREILLFNRGAARIFGYAPAEIIGRPVEELLPLANRLAHPAQVEGFARGPEVSRVMGERRMVSGRRKDGTEFPADVTISKLERGGEMLLTAIVRDATVRERYEDALVRMNQELEERVRARTVELAASRQRLQALFEGAQDAILIIDDDGRFVDANPAAGELTGYSLTELQGLSRGDLTPSSDVPDANGRWEAFLRDGRQSGDQVVVRKDGSTVPVEYRAVARIQPGRHLSILRDITDRKRAEEELRGTARQRTQALADLQAKTDELRTTTQQLWQAARLAGVGELAASIAHELNNPLGTVSLRIEGVLAKTPLDDPRRRPLEVIDQEVERMGKLVGNLLHFSRAGRDQVSTVNVPEEVARTIELTAPHFRRKGVEVRPEIHPDVPDIYADRQQLRQVLLNLFTNAGDAMPKGGRLTSSVRRGELPGVRPAVILEVIDTGTGIPAEILPRVFDTFFTTKEEGKGTGLGLPICKRIVEQHQGLLEIESESGRGTTVRVTLPVRNEANVARLDD